MGVGGYFKWDACLGLHYRRMKMEDLLFEELLCIADTEALEGCEGGDLQILPKFE